MAKVLLPAPGDGRAHAELSTRDRAFVIGFNDSRLEWIRIGAELFGTFLLVLVAAGAGIVDSTTPCAVGRVAEVTAPGLMVMVIILSLGAITGAHLNPLATIAHESGAVVRPRNVQIPTIFIPAES